MKLRILIVILVGFGVAIPYAQAQDTETREVYISGIGSDKNEAIKDALSKAVAQVCGQRVSASQNIENDMKSQANYSSDGKVSSVDRTKRSNEKVNALSDGMAEKYEILSETKWTDGNIKLDIIATIGKCFVPDSVSDQLVSNSDQTNKLLSKVLATMDENSDPRGIKPTDDRWDVMAKEMWHANFSAYKRQGQFKNEDQAKLALERGFHNRDHLESALDQEIFLKLSSPTIQKDQVFPLLSQVSDSFTGNMQHSQYLDRMLLDLQRERLVFFETIQKCGTRVQKGFFTWGLRGSVSMEPNEELKNYYDKLIGDREDVEIKFLNRVIGTPLPAPNEARLTAIARANANLDTARIIFGLNQQSGCTDSRGATGKVLAYNEAAVTKINPICADLKMINSLRREKQLQEQSSASEILDICSLAEQEIISIFSNADVEKMPMSQRKSILSQSINGDIISDYLNIKHSNIEMIYKILTNGWLKCTGKIGEQPRQASEIRYLKQECRSPSNLNWTNHTYFEENPDGASNINKLRRKFCNTINDLKINLYDESFLKTEVNDTTGQRDSFSDAFLVFC